MASITNHKRLYILVALLLLSVGLFMGYNSVFAVHEDNRFQLDGNALAVDLSPNGEIGDDWDNVIEAGTAFETVFLPDEPTFGGTLGAHLAGGGSKDELDFTEWEHAPRAPRPG